MLPSRSFVHREKETNNKNVHAHSHTTDEQNRVNGILTVRLYEVQEEYALCSYSIQNKHLI